MHIAMQSAANVWVHRFARIAFFTRIPLDPLIPCYYYRATVYSRLRFIRIGAANKSLFHTEPPQRENLPAFRKKGAINENIIYQLKVTLDTILSPSATLLSYSFPTHYIYLPTLSLSRGNNLPTSFIHFPSCVSCEIDRSSKRRVARYFAGAAFKSPHVTADKRCARNVRGRSLSADNWLR